MLVLFSYINRSLQIHKLYYKRFYFKFVMFKKVLLTLSLLSNFYSIAVSPRIYLMEQTIEFYIFRYPTSTALQYRMIKFLYPAIHPVCTLRIGFLIYPILNLNYWLTALCIHMVQ